MKKGFKNKKINKNKIIRRAALILSAIIALEGVYILRDILKSKETAREIFGDYNEEMISELIDSLETTNPTEIEEIVAEVVSHMNINDTVIMNEDTSLRINSNDTSYITGSINKGTVVERILNNNGWDLIRYDGKLLYVHEDTTTAYNDPSKQDYYIDKEEDILRTITPTKLRLNPSETSEEICELDLNEELTVIGKACLYSNENEVWYLVHAVGHIGFVKATEVMSLKNLLYQMDSTLSNITVKKMGVNLQDTKLLNNMYEPLPITIDKYQTFELIEEYGDYYLVIVENEIGYIRKEDTKILEGIFVVVDIDTQRIYLYNGTEMVYKGKCTTGRRFHETTPGFYEKSLYKGNYCKFDSKHTARILWQHVYNGEGLHDAPWEPEECFGDPFYYLDHGSDGCVRLRDQDARFFYDHIDTNTPITVQKNKLQ